MTSALLTPWWRNRKSISEGASVAGGTAPSRILDWQTAGIQNLIHDVHQLAPADEVDLVRRAHTLIADETRPVYSLDDAQPASVTLAKGRGSCSQRLAVLEAVARGSKIATRVRGLIVDGRFWYPRFPRYRFLVPGEIVLAWPEFLLDGIWVEASELFGSLEELGAGNSGGFANTGGETLFDALPRTAVDWDGRTSNPGRRAPSDLSSHVLADLGRYNSRDDLFRIQGQTLSWWAQTLLEPALGRWSA